MNVNVTLAQLRAFSAVADARNFRAAGEVLHLSQSGVSVQVAALERALRISLIERRRSGWRLTPEGELVLARAREVVNAATRLESEAAALRVEVRGQFRLGATLTIADLSLITMLAEYLRRHADVRVAVRVQNTRAIEAALLAGDLEIALVEGALTSPRLVEVPYEVDRLVVVCPPGHRFAARPTVAPADLCTEPLVAREPGSGSRALIEERLGVRLADLPLRMELASVRAILSAVEAGMGVAILSAASIVDALDEGLIVALDIEGVDLSRTFRLVHLAEGPSNGAARSFAAFVRAIARPEATMVPASSALS
ncbi:MAG: selenium metabolism-associated LysR family transcriptional regulator [Candidatus Dormibacteria bacterium]